MLLAKYVSKGIIKPLFARLKKKLANKNQES